MFSRLWHLSYVGSLICTLKMMSLWVYYSWIGFFSFWIEYPCGPCNHIRETRVSSQNQLTMNWIIDVSIKDCDVSPYFRFGSSTRHIFRNRVKDFHHNYPNVLGFIIFPPDIFVVFWLFAHKWNLGSLLSLLGAYHGL